MIYEPNIVIYREVFLINIIRYIEYQVAYNKFIKDYCWMIEILREELQFDSIQMLNFD